jgi:hypothetical protein
MFAFIAGSDASQSYVNPVPFLCCQVGADLLEDLIKRIVIRVLIDIQVDPVTDAASHMDNIN